MSNAKVEFSGGEPRPNPEDILQQLERSFRQRRALLAGAWQEIPSLRGHRDAGGRAQFLATADRQAKSSVGRVRSTRRTTRSSGSKPAGFAGLERYYLVAGQADPIVITIPKGGTFLISIMPSQPAQAADAEPRSERETLHLPVDRGDGHTVYLRWRPAPCS